MGACSYNVNSSDHCRGCEGDLRAALVKANAETQALREEVARLKVTPKRAARIYVSPHSGLISATVSGVPFDLKLFPESIDRELRAGRLEWTPGHIEGLAGVVRGLLEAAGCGVEQIWVDT